MSTEQNRTVVRRLYDDVLNGRRIELIDHLVVGDYIDHDRLPGQRDGRPGLVDNVSALAAGLDPRFTIEDVIAEGDRVAVRWINEGTHVAEFLGVPPTGRSFRFAGIDIYRVDGGMLAEHWHVVDQLTMFQQLGLIPTPEGAPA
jgi:predicted ester cyclase